MSDLEKSMFSISKTTWVITIICCILFVIFGSIFILHKINHDDKIQKEKIVRGNADHHVNLIWSEVVRDSKSNWAYGDNICISKVEIDGKEFYLLTKRAQTYFQLIPINKER